MLLALLGALFIALGLPFVRGLGIEADEALVANGIYPRAAPWYSWDIGEDEIPIMILSYVGALKAWIMNLLLLIWSPGKMVLRMPGLLLGAMAIWLFWLLLDRVAGVRAAWIGAVMLAADTSFLLTQTVDLGFVAMQHVFKLGACLLLFDFYRSGSERRLAAGFFLLGLGVWDKAIFGWVIVGLALAAILVFPREVKANLRLRPLAIASCAALAGALPFVVYNTARPLETLRMNAGFENAPLAGKFHLLRETVNGRILFGFLTSEDPGPRPNQLKRWPVKLADWISNLAGNPRRNFFELAVIAATASIVFLRRTPALKPMLFALLYLAVVWIQMTLTAGAGGAAHHIILLWPFHFLLIAIALAHMPWRGAAVAITAVLCGSSLLVTAHYWSDLVRNGPAIRWTDAIHTLNDSLAKLRAERIFVMDWGIIETINFLSEGATPVQFAEALDDNSNIHAAIAGPKNVFVDHTPQFSILPATRRVFDHVAAAGGFHKETMETIYDRNGRPIFEIFRFRAAP